MRPRVYFTKAGYASRRLLVQDRRALNSLTQAHLRQELELDSMPAGEWQHPQGRR